MRMFVPCTVLLSTLSLSSCNNAAPKNADISSATPDTSTAAQVTLTAAVPTVYTWNTMRSGPSCLQQLRQLMDWYATQAETIKQFDFTPGATTDGPVRGGPYRVDMGMVDAYLDLLHKAGYFSASYVDSLRKNARLQEAILQRKQPAANTAATIPGLPLFALNYDDMLEQSEQFKFTVDQRNHTILFNDGTGLQRFVFDKNCKLLASKWLGYVPKQLLKQ